MDKGTYDRITVALYNILDKAGITPSVFSLSIEEGTGEFESGVPSVWMKATRKDPFAVNKGSTSIEDTLNRVASQINQYFEMGANAVARATSMYTERELANNHRSDWKPKNTLVVDAGFFSSPERLNELETLATDFKLGKLPKAASSRSR